MGRGILRLQATGKTLALLVADYDFLCYLQFTRGLRHRRPSSLAAGALDAPAQRFLMEQFEASCTSGGRLLRGASGLLHDPLLSCYCVADRRSTLAFIPARVLCKQLLIG